MRFSSPRRRSAMPINMAPLIDLMFLLVIFIMVVAQFEPDAGININLAKGGAARQPETRAWRLTLAEGGGLFFGAEAVAAHELEARIARERQAAAAEGLDPTLVIRIDYRIPWEDVVPVLDAVKRAGQQRIDLATAVP